MWEKKGKWLTVAVVALIVLQLITLAQVNQLRNEMYNLTNQVNNLQGAIQNDIAAISSNLQQQLEQEASLIDSYSYELGQLDPDELTMAVTVTVCPKELAADTSATLKQNGQSFPMERRGDSFLATIDIDLFQTIEQPTVILETDGLRQQETLELGFDPRYEALPQMNAWLDREGGSTTFSAGKGGTGTYFFSGSLQIDLISKTSIGQAVSLTDLCLIAEVDGAEVWRLEQADFPDSDLDGHRDDGQLVLTQFDPAVEFSLSPGQTLVVYVQAEDAYGILHRVELEQVTLNESGEPSWNEDNWLSGEEILLDQKGTVLWPPEY